VINDQDPFGYLVRGLLVLMPVLVGVGFLAVTARRWLGLRRLALSGERATAVVVGNQQESHDEGWIVFRPVVEFTTATGNRLRTVLEDLGGPRSHLVGSEIPVVFDPEAPTGAVPVGSRTGQTIAAVVVCLIFIGFGVLAHFLIASTGGL
jgi:hypothetical protein